VIAHLRSAGFSGIDFYFVTRLIAWAFASTLVQVFRTYHFISFLAISLHPIPVQVFVMHERGKGANSFWWPFLRSLPAPSTTLDWTDEELSLLQHDSLSSRSKSRKQRLSSVHNRVFVEHLAPRYPEIFGYVSHNDAVGSGNESSDNKGASSGKVLEAWWSLEAFEFAWGTVQARAFGKRLPWSALVPLADLLVKESLCLRLC